MVRLLQVHIAFLKDVLVLAVTAFGGPNVHLTLFLDRLVVQRKYLDETELMEIIGLCQLMPGPTSTQAITAIGYRQGGPLLAFITLMVWALPGIAVMTTLALLYGYLNRWGLSGYYFQFIPPMAVGFIAYAALNLGRKVVKSAITFVAWLAGATLPLYFNSPLVFPLVIVLGGLITYFALSGGTRVKAPAGIRPNWTYLLLYAGIFAVSAALAIAFKYKPVVLFENFYRFGSLIFGGGQVLIPMMLDHFTQHRAYLSEEAFLTGYGLVQASPGPVFAFCAFAGGLAMADMGGWTGILAGSLIGVIGIFLPGTLLIFFAYPMLQWLKQFPAVQRAMPGINAAAGGLVFTAVVFMAASLDFDYYDPTIHDWLKVSIAITCFAILQFTRLPAPILVVATLLAGFIAGRDFTL
jgi:chromate transporter